MWSVKKNGPQSIGKSKGGRTTKIHMIAASDQVAVTFMLSPGNCHDDPEGRELMSGLERGNDGASILMDRAYESDATRNLVVELGYTPVVPPKSNRKEPWDYDKELYKRRNEVERLFRRLKGFRRIFTRYEKLDILFAGFILFAL